MSPEYLEVINDYEKLFENERGYDVIIYAGENENQRKIRVHSLILSTRSQYFYTELSKKNIEKRDGKIILKIPDISPKSLKIILRFIYCGKINWTTLEFPELLKLSIEVDKLNIHSLVSKIEEYLIQHLLDQNLVDILEMTYQHKSFANLQNFCLEKVCENPEMLFNSKKFINLKPPLLELFLRRDDLNLDEIDIWNSLLKWGFAQNPSISQDSTKWNKEEIMIMERTLHRFISLVRFYHMSPEDFLDRVYPLRRLLTEDLISNILNFHMVPDRNTNIDIYPLRKLKQKIDSVIIKPEHLAIFASWIDKRENLHYNINNIPYNFKLLYRANRDGDTAATFHKKCDNKGSTIVIAKMTNSEHILGGYNSRHWDSSSGWLFTKDSFIFSFTNRKNIQTAKVGYNSDQCSTMYCNQSCGPAFGGGYNLSFQYNNTTNSVSYRLPKIDIPAVDYTRLDGNDLFNVEDYEVFQVIKK